MEGLMACGGANEPSEIDLVQQKGAGVLLRSGLQLPLRETWGKRYSFSSSRTYPVSPAAPLQAPRLKWLPCPPSRSPARSAPRSC